MPLARQQAVIDYMRAQLHPPAGVTAQLAGLPVLAAEADQSLSSSSHRLLTLLAGLIAVGLVLAIVFRAIGRAVVPMVPIALATGWSALILYLIGIPLNPMSATLGALVIAISTEFSVLLSERFRQERAAGHDLSEALARTYRSTGAAVLASGVTAIVGFGVLIFSNITMLRDFGFVTLVDLTVSLGGVLLVLPAVLALSERGDLLAPLRVRDRRHGRAADPAAAPPPGGVSDAPEDPDPPEPGPARVRSARIGPAPARPATLRHPRRCAAWTLISPPAAHRRRRRRAPTPDPGRLTRPVTVDTRRYRWMLGIFGLALVIVASIYQFATNGVASTGVAPGHRLHWFAAPLATSTLIGDPNVSPPCTLAQHDPRALNICLIASQRPLVLSLFVIGSTDCEHQVDTLQALSRRYPAIQFAAVAINGSRADTAALVRSHHWTIPIAYDRDGTVGGLYGVAVCPMAELADPGRDRSRPAGRQSVADRGSAHPAGRRPGPRRGTMSEPDAALRPAEGFVDSEVAAEFPGLRLQWATADGRRRPSPPSVVRSLQQVANRYRGASVVAMRTKPVPHAYRAFFRQIGLDPDVQRIPSERAALARLVQGGFRSVDLITDACLIALIETGVPVTALDAGVVDAGGLGIRPAVTGDMEDAGTDAGWLAPGTLAVADRRTIHAPLFGDPVTGHGPGPATERVTLYTIGVDGVPAIHLEEALWVVLELLG